MSKKVLVIGLDGATWDLIKPWAEEGKLPTFKKLMENGVWGYIESTYPPWTSPAWESMCTGKTPATLDAGMFLIKKGKKFVPSSYYVEKIPKIWDLLSQKGLKICVANVPCLTKPYKINGYLVVGFTYREKENLTYPQELIGELHLASNGYEVDIVKTSEKGLAYVPPKENIYDEVQKLFEKHFKAFKYLLTEKDWDFAFIVFVTPDRLQHRLWNNKKILLNHFKTLDKGISKLSKPLKDANIFIVSDHGFGKREFTFRVNEWLIKEGYLVLKSQLKENKILTLFKKMNLLSFLEKISKLIPSFIKNKVFKRVVKGFFEFQNDIDWKKTKAFSYAGMGEIYVNLKGRYPDGCVSLEEYERIRKEIIEKIRSLKHPITGNKLNIKIYKKEDVYLNTNINDTLPDIIIIPTDDGIQAFSPSIGYGKIFTTVSKDEGNHRLHGIFLAYGPDIKNTGEEIKNLKIYDIAPTILHMFNLPIPKDMDGRVLREIFKENSEIAKRKPKYVDPDYYLKKEFSEKERIRERIRKLKKFS